MDADKRDKTPGSVAKDFSTYSAAAGRSFMVVPTLLAPQLPQGLSVGAQIDRGHAVGLFHS